MRSTRARCRSSATNGSWALSWFSPHRDASRTRLGAVDIDGTVESGSTNFFIPEFAVNWKYRPDLSLGVTVYGNGGMNTDYPGGQIPAQSACTGFRVHRYSRGPYNMMCGNGTLGVDMMQLLIAPYASWQFTKGHSVGIAPVIAYQRFKAEGLQAFDNPMLSSSPGNVTNNGYSDSWGLGVRVGYMGQFNDVFSVGIAYASKISMGNFDKYKGLFAEEGGFDIPSNFTAGFAFRPTKQWLLALDFERIYYDDAKSVSNPRQLDRLLPPPPMGGPASATTAWAAAPVLASAGRTSTSGRSASSTSSTRSGRSAAGTTTPTTRSSRRMSRSTSSRRAW